MSNKPTKYAVTLLIATGTSAVMMPAYSQLEEVIVTAQRRAESVQDIPVAVSAISGDQLSQFQITETLDVAKMVPNMIANNNTGTGSANNYSMRGLSNAESIATFDPPVGSYIGDTFIQRQNANNFSLFDIERIEVLRGPQGTLFGRNTTGGAVRVILKAPAEELGGFMEAGYGEFNKRLLRGSIDLPISDKVLTKFSAYGLEDDGYVDNVSGSGPDELNNEKSIGMRAAVRVDITDTVAWNGAVSYSNSENANVYNVAVGGDRESNSGLAKGALVGLLRGGKANLPGNSNEVESTLFESNLELETSFGSLSFITSYLTLDQDFALDFANGPVPTGGFTVANQSEHDQFSQEIKLTGSVLDDDLRYVVGFYYFDEDNHTDLGDVLYTPGATLVLADRILDNTTQAWAVYSQFDYLFAEKWTATLGVRYTDEDKDIAFTDNLGGDLTSAGMDALGIPRDQNTTETTPRFALQYQYNDDIQAYASVTKGFKSGGWNARGTTPDQLIPFGPEIVTNYETGLKSDWLNSHLRINLTAFYTDVEGFQIPSGIRRPSGAIAFITRNSSDLEVTGFEAEIVATPVSNLTLFVSIGIQDGEFRNLDPSIIAQQSDCQQTGEQCGVGIVTLTGSIADPVRMPDYTFTAGGNYLWSLGDSLTLIPSIIYTDTGDHTIGSSNLPGQVDISYSNLNTGLTLENEAGGWSLSLDCKNCTDEEQEATGLAGLIYLNEPRRWELRARYNF